MQSRREDRFNPSVEKHGEHFELVAIDMGLGHLRPAQAISDFCGNQEILLADAPPLATEAEQKKWKRARSAYELLSKAGKTPIVGPILSHLLDEVTRIPHLYPRRDLSTHTLAVRSLTAAAHAGMGLGLAQRLEQRGSSLLTTFFAPAVLCDLHGSDSIYCVVTDSDVNRIWAPVEPQHSRVIYLAPSQRVRARLRAYGVSKDKIVVTGYPLPHELVGGPDAELLRANLRRRLVALDPRGRFLRECREEVSYFLGPLPENTEEVPPHLVFAVGGAGAQTELVDQFLPDLARLIRSRKLRLTLVAGLRPEVSECFARSIQRAELEAEANEGWIKILACQSHKEYFTRFNELLKEADILWTKPSELSFFGALGIPLLFSRPVGSHERYNRRWAETMGAGVRQRDLRHTGHWLREMLKDGTFAGAAWTGYMRMPKFGLYRIIEEVLGKSALEERLVSQTTHL